jgi:hypothetical protein
MLEDNILTTSRTDCLEIWEPRRFGNRRACPALYRDCFTLLTTVVCVYIRYASLSYRIYLQYLGSDISLITLLSSNLSLLFL